MSRVLVLWAVPRSASTAFERMMRQRGDFTCLHEPFGEVWYSGDDSRCPPAHRLEYRPGLTYESVWRDLQEMAAAGPVFSKDFPHHVSHLIDDGFLDFFQHSFLIRDPAKTLPSVFDHWPDFTLEETGYAEQRALFDRLTERDGQPPPVIDAEDLLDDPAGITAAWCGAVGIAFVAEALEWAPSSPSEHSWYDGGSWHGKLAQSTGLGRQEREYVSIDDNPHLLDSYRACEPHYEHLRRHRLQAPA